MKSSFVSLLSASCTFALAGVFGTVSNVQAANIGWVSFHSADNTPSAAAAAAGFTQAPDVEYTRLLKAVGHTVTRYVTTATPDTNLLNSFDLVIISRSVPSGNYQTPESTALWHSLTKPTILLGGYILRANRLGYTTGDTIPDTTAEIRLSVAQPAHPIFTGVTLDPAALMVNPYAHRVMFNGVLQQGISVNTSEPTPGSTVLATVGTDSDPAFGGMIIGEFPAGTVMSNASGDTTAAKRLVLLTGSREQGITSEAAGIFDLDTDGARLFLNAVSYMTGAPVTEPPPIVSNLQPSTGTTLYLAERGLSFRVQSGTAGGVAASNISLVLNGVNVSSNLVIGGTAQDRSVSFTNLVANTNYSGTIIARDSGNRESTVTFTFDTLPPLAISPSYAYPTNTAVATASGMRARIVQGYDTPTLANTSDRAERQLAGTLIDAATGEVVPNQATQSTDNPDGSYNTTLINWSVQAGTGTERGSFQAPQFPDEPFPGLAHNNNFTVEVLTYLELPVGRYVMGVNSDDGFVVSTGIHPRDIFPTILGRFDGGRGAADTTFQFRVTEAGLYPFRLVYYQGDGDGNLEWFIMNPLTGEKILINDRNNPQAIRAWRQISAPERPFIATITPKPGERNVEVNTNLTITIQDVGAQVQTNTIQLTANGATLQPQITKSNGVTTVRYVPAQNLQGDTIYNLALTYGDTASSTRTATFDIGTRFVPPTRQGANIVWVSFHAADDQPSANAANAGFTNAPDIGYTRLLTEAGHKVTRYVTTGTPDVDLLRTFDLVIISRSNPSGNFQSAASTALWHSLTNPTIHLGGYAIRASRLGFTTGETIPDTASTIRLKVNDPAHPIFAGVSLDATTNMVNPFAHLVSYNGTVQRGISVNTSPVIAGAKVLAAVSAGDPASGGMVIGEYPAGTTMGNASHDVTAGKRLVFLTGSREQGITGDGAGLYDLDGDGAKLFLNAVNYMAGLVSTNPPSVSLTATLGANNQLTISWPETGTEGFGLQSSTNLSTVSWQAVTTAPVVANGRRSVTVTASDPARFYRLVRP